MYLRAKIAPAMAVEDHSIDPRPKLRINLLVKFFLPPKIKRQVRIQIGEDDVWQLRGAPALEQKRNLLRANLLAANAAHVAVRTDPGANEVVACVAISFDDDRATGVILGDSR